jgi:hypothetical protein
VGGIPPAFLRVVMGKSPAFRPNPGWSGAGGIVSLDPRT